MKASTCVNCTFILLLGCLIQNTLAASSVWKVSKNGNYFYIGGTIHLLAKSDHPLPDEFTEAYNDASEIYFETDMTAIQQPEFQSKLLNAMTYADDRNLSSALKPEMYRNLQNFMMARKIPIENFSNFQPWGVSLVITMMEYQRLGMMPNYGVDEYFNGLAMKDKKSIGILETPEEQLKFLTSLKEMSPNESIEYMLRDMDDLPKFIGMMKSAWRLGDIEAFTSSAYIKKMKIDFPKIYNTLVVNRNNRWMSQIPSFMNDNSKEFLLVGTLHLNGKKGLLNQLKMQGYKVEQL